ncbi:unnamed protein product [Pleuronectes platessa]|uniref:Uncharacterized protein n=1 Tax=Pleuronectes platessa TaxID=8262 RepID=A0A9N7UGQ1_PLEPL|nr:unnamed protein product [Pleuronectes platessa]
MDFRTYDFISAARLNVRLMQCGKVFPFSSERAFHPTTRALLSRVSALSCRHCEGADTGGSAVAELTALLFSESVVIFYNVHRFAELPDQCHICLHCRSNLHQEDPTCSKPAGTGARGTHRNPVEPQGSSLRIHVFLKCLQSA